MHDADGLRRSAADFGGRILQIGVEASDVLRVLGERYQMQEQSLHIGVAGFGEQAPEGRKGLLFARFDEQIQCGKTFDRGIQLQNSELEELYFVLTRYFLG